MRKVSLEAVRLTSCPEPQSFESMCLARAEYLIAGEAW